jgi:adenylyltransferase/sulfurtransferase
MPESHTCICQSLAKPENTNKAFLQAKNREMEEAEERLSNGEIVRYGRQLVLDEVGSEGQLRLKRARLLVVGAGGLGSGLLPAVVAAGVGTVGIADGDCVEESNLQRQTLHGENDVGKSKVASAAAALGRINSSCRLEQHYERIGRSGVLELVARYDVVADCTDSAAARYALSDACVAAGVPLVAASALGWQGQLSVYNLGAAGPCYRCVFPSAPPPAAQGSCSDNGVLGAVTAAVGGMQALEVLKVLLAAGDTLSGRMLLYDGLRAKVRVVRLRSRRADCPCCSLDRSTIMSRFGDAEEPSCDVERDDELEMSAAECRAVMAGGGQVCVVDVRSGAQRSICRLAGSLHCPLAGLSDAAVAALPTAQGGVLLFVCRRGVDSLVAARKAAGLLPGVRCVSMRGGLQAWSRTVDPSFPVY